MVKTVFSWLRNRENRYVACLMLFFGGLMFSKAILSISVAAIAANWLADHHIKLKLKSILSNKPLLAVLAMFGIHLTGLLYTSDFNYALSDLRIKLPILVLPLVFATENPFQPNSFKRVIHSFLFFVIVSAVISLVIYSDSEFFALRSISPFMSHIRFGILTTIASFYMFYLFFKSNNKLSLYALMQIAGAVFLASFTILILGSVNALFLFSMLFLFWAVVVIFRTKKRIVSLALILLLFIIITVPASYIVHVHNKYFPDEMHAPENIPTHTLQGNQYIHEHDNPVFENGIHVYGYYCKQELTQEWNERSRVDINDYALNRFSIHDVAIRYLTSKNLPKDSFGIAQLSDKDIGNIEQGITNYRLAGKTPLEFRLYELFQGYYTYKHFNNTNNNSLFLRLEFWKTAFGIIKEYPLFGVGTGDVNQAFEHQYEKMNTTLDPEWRLRAHNQYISITVALGMIGLLVFLFALIYPPLKRKKFTSFYFVSAYIVLLLSMISEDTIETQIGVSIFSFFYSFFLFTEPDTDANNIKKIT